MSPKKQAIKLREEGFSYTYIQTKTKLSKSTLSYLLRDIPYTPNTHTIKTTSLAQVKSGLSKANAKRQSITDAKIQSVKDIHVLTERDIFMLGIGLYIGEGSKTQNIIRLVNTDARVINLFIRWLTSLGYDKHGLAIRIHLYPDSNVAEAEAYWAQKTCNPVSFKKPALMLVLRKIEKGAVPMLTGQLISPCVLVAIKNSGWIFLD